MTATPSTQPRPVQGGQLAFPDRRGATRYEPEAWVPVFFHDPAWTEPCSGYVADVSATGLRIVAPPTTRPHVWWGDRVRIEVASSPATRQRGLDGVVVLGHLARMTLDSDGMTLGIRLDLPIDPLRWIGPESGP
jgi:hypothetical protein